jgi:hypothetical protein
MNSSSSRLYTLPVGLFGLQMMIAFVRSLNAAFNSSRSKNEAVVGAIKRNVTEARRRRGWRPGVVLVERLENDDLLTGIYRRQHARDHTFGRAAGSPMISVSGSISIPRNHIVFFAIASRNSFTPHVTAY